MCGSLKFLKPLKRLYVVAQNVNSIRPCLQQLPCIHGVHVLGPAVASGLCRASEGEDVSGQTLHLATPGCPSCSSASTAFRPDLGITTRDPNNTHPSNNASYGNKELGRTGHPYCSACTTGASSGSPVVHCGAVTGESARCSVSSTR